MSVSKENRKFLKHLSFLAVPIVLQEFLNTSVNLLDSVMVGTLELNAINGVGSANQIFFLFALILFGINSGSSIYMGQFWGKNDVKSIRKVMGICVVSGMVVALIFVVLAWTIPNVLIGLFSKEAEVIRLGSEYIRIVAFSYFFSAIIVAINSSLKSIGQTKLPMTTTFISLIFNGGLNYVFIFVLHWGVAGAAFATVMARVIELTSQLIIINRLHIPVVGKISDYFSASKIFIKDFFKMTVPVILNEFIWALGTMTYFIAYQFCGNEAQGAVQIAGNVQNLFNVIGMGIGSACGILLSNLLGAGELEKAVIYSRKCLKISVCISSFMGICLILGSPLIISIYNVSDMVKELASALMWVVAFGMIIKTYNFTTIVGILRSGGDTRFCLKIDLISVWAIGVPAAFLGAWLFNLPIYVVVALVYIEEIFKVFASTKRVISKKWVVCVV